MFTAEARRRVRRDTVCYAADVLLRMPVPEIPFSIETPNRPASCFLFAELLAQFIVRLARK